MAFQFRMEDLATTLPNRIETGLLPHQDPHIVYEVIAQLAEIGVPVKAFPVVGAEWKDFCRRVRYEDCHPGYGGRYFIEKSLEHFLIYTLLHPGPEDLLLEIVTEDSPFGDLVRRLSGTQVLTQDTRPKAGIQDTHVGGNPCQLPLADNSVSKVALISSLEHFERTSDMRLFEELTRVVCSGGRVVALPLYLFTEPAVQTDPAMIEPSSPSPFDPAALIRCVDGWGHRHGRFYSAMTLRERLLGYNRWWRFTVYHALGTEHIGANIYLRFVLLAERV